MHIRHFRAPKVSRPNRHRMLTLLPKLPRPVSPLWISDNVGKGGNDNLKVSHLGRKVILKN